MPLRVRPCSRLVYTSGGAMPFASLDMAKPAKSNVFSGQPRASLASAKECTANLALFQAAGGISTGEVIA
eukprot:s1078_g3.t1